MSDSYFGGCNETLALREKLQKYLYVPKMVDGAVVINKASTTTTTTINSKKRMRKRKHRLSSTMATTVNCNLCGIPLTGSRRQQLNQRQSSKMMMSCLRFCQMCKRALAQYYTDESSAAAAGDNNRSIIINSTTSSQRKSVNPYVLSRLKKLGTTVVRESCVAGAAAVRDDGNELAVVAATSSTTTISSTDDDVSSTSTSNIAYSAKFDKNHFYIIDDDEDDYIENDDTPHVIRSQFKDCGSSVCVSGGGGGGGDGYVSSNSSHKNLQYRNEKNEIVLAFDRTVTEVFPAMTISVNGCGGDDDGAADDDDNDVVMIIDDEDGGLRNIDEDMKETQREDIHGGAVNDINVINDIYKRIPKSLSITLLA